MIHAITILFGNPLTSEVGQHIQKWNTCQANLSHTTFALRWDPIQFEDNKNLQKYEESNGSISYLKSNTVKQLVNLKIYMTLLISQHRPSDQIYNLLHFILGEQLFKLTAIDMKTALINEMLENSRPKTTPRALQSMITSASSSASMRSPIHLELAPFKKSIIPGNPPLDVNKSHLSSITNLDVTCSLDISCDHLLHLDSPSHSSDPQDTSSVENVEIEFIHESEEPLEINKPSPKDVFISYHDYDLFLLNQEIDTPPDNLNHHDTHVCKNQDDILIHATNLSHTFTLPQFMAQHNYEHLKPTDTPSTVPIAIQAPSDHTFNPKCAHNLMATQCNQSQYST